MHLVCTLLIDVRPDVHLDVQFIVVIVLGLSLRKGTASS